jgi:hypothetical protein
MRQIRGQLWDFALVALRLTDLRDGSPRMERVPRVTRLDSVFAQVDFAQRPKFIGVPTAGPIAGDDLRLNDDDGLPTCRQTLCPTTLAICARGAVDEP